MRPGTFPKDIGTGKLMPRVDILLATYNGAKYLREQLASLVAQTHTDWRLIVRDDGSDDGSIDVVRQWADDAKCELLVLKDGDTRIGPAQSFGRLLARSDAPYFAFCDQDDFWRENKIERLLDEIQTLEVNFGETTPLLVHCDLEIVDAKLNSTGKLLWQQSRISTVSFGKSAPNKRARSGLLLQNVVTGCAALGNAELRRRATPLPENVHVHDWWVALIAAHFGAICGVPDPLVRYRQHGANTIGASAWDPVSMSKRFLSDPVAAIKKISVVLGKLQRQARCFVDAFGNSLDESDRRAILEFATLSDRGLIKRKTFMISRGIYPQTRLRGLLLFCLI